MAKKMRKITSLLMALILCVSQLAVPALAAEADEQQIGVEVDLSPYSQIPEETENLSVEEQELVETTDHDETAGLITNTTSQTTTWEGSDGQTSVTGSETVSDYTVTDDFTGDELQKGGALEGSETSVTTTKTTETKTETIITSETGVTSTTETTESSTTESKTEADGQTVEGQWSQQKLIDSDTKIQQQSNEAIDKDSSKPYGSAELPEEGVTIILTPDPNNPGKFIGAANGAEVAIEVPEGAEPIYEDGVLVGYKEIFDVSTDTKEVDRQTKTETGTVTKDTDPEITHVTPDRSSFEHLLTDDSVVTEEYDENDPSKVTAYVITNTTENTTSGSGIQMPTRPADGISTDENGNTVTITSSDVTDEEGKVIGYTYRQVVTDASGAVLQDATTTLTMEDGALPQATAPQTTFTLPEKPAESDTTDADGIRTRITVEDIYDENGEHVGYKAITVQTDSEGNELFRETHDTYGTETTVEKEVSMGAESCTANWTMTTTTTDTYRVTAEQKLYEDLQRITELTTIWAEGTRETNYQIVEIDGSLYMLYSGEMFVGEGGNHGNIKNMIPVTPDKDLFKSDDSQDLATGGEDVVSDAVSDNSGFKYVGEGIDSSLNVNYSNTYTLVNQFRLLSPNNKEFYALCVDLDTYIVAGHLYKIEDIHEAAYLEKGTADKIRSIALNGYWGTESGIGSLEDLKDLVEDYLDKKTDMSQKDIDDIIDTLTHGQALSGTQAALWTYGDSGENPVNTRNLISGSDETDERNAKAVYDALVNTANDPNAQLEDSEGVEFLDAEDITGGAITINSKVIDPENPQTDTNLYNADLSFTLGIEPAKLFGDLIVTVTVGDEQIGKYRLAGNDDPLLELGRVVQNSDGSYTIPGVQLAPGVNVNLNLSGTQGLGTGVYIYTSVSGQFGKSQTLVTLAGGSRSVDLDMNMTFEVKEPTATATKYQSVDILEETEEFLRSRTDTLPRTETTTTIEKLSKTTETYEAELICTAEATISTETTEQSKEARSWFAGWEKDIPQIPVPQNDDYPIPDPGDKPGDKPGNEPTTEIPDEDVPLSDTVEILDEDVPLAATPKTGDITLLLAAVSLTSLGGLALLSSKKKED